jgi:tetratricopeptide (TPR) repeat protein/DNA-binding winged helix-turn-helix (wHTH) protein
VGLLRLVGCTVDLELGVVQGSSASVLTELELGLLRYLAGRPHQEVDRETLLRDVFGYAPSSVTRAVDKTLANLRKKVELDPGYPDHIQTVRGVGYRFVPAELSSRPELPREQGPFVGRAAELQVLGRWLERPGLVTLAGPGGVGKTRLAIRAARAFARGERSAIFCALAESRPEDCLQKIALALQVPLSGASPEPVQTAQLGRALASHGELLLVLDEVEHLQELPFLEELARHAPQLRFLLTTRVDRGLSGDPARILRVGPLSRAQSVELLVACADARGCALAEQDPSLSSLARLLDDLPLALTLAASWFEVLGPAQLLQRFQGGDGLVTLDGALERSWALLDELERAALAELSVFRGGFDADAASAVLTQVRGRPPLPLLRSLVRASLVQRSDGGSVRLALLEQVRAFACRRLPERTERARLAHARWFARLGSEAPSRRHVDELDNVVAALRHSVAQGEAELAVDCLRAACRAAEITGASAPCLELVRTVLALPLQGTLRGRALLEQAWALWASDLGPEEVDQVLQEAAPLVASDPDLTARILSHQARLLYRQGQMEPCRARWQSVLDLARSPEILATAWRKLGDIARDRGEYDEATTRYQHALELYGRAGCSHLVARARISLGSTCALRGDLAGARLAYEQAATELHALGGRRLLARLCGNLGTVLYAEDDLQGAVARYQQAVAESRAMGLERELMQWLRILASALLGLERMEEADRALAEAEALAPSVADALTAANLLAMRGRLWLAQGHPKRAVQVLVRALDELEEIGGRYYQIGVRCTLAEARSALGQGEQAEAELALASQMVEALDLGPRAGARKLVERALSRYSPSGTGATVRR